MRTQVWLVLHLTVASYISRVAHSLSVPSLIIANERRCNRLRHSLFGVDYCGQCSNGEITTDCIRTTNDGTHNHERNRRAVLAAIFVSSAGIHPNAAYAATKRDDEGFDTPVMNDLTRQIRTSIVRGAQLIDKVDGAWERFSDDLSLGSKRNRPKRNVIDAGGNFQTKKVVKSESMDGRDLIFDDTFAFSILGLCDEAFLECLKYQQPQISINKLELSQKVDKTKQSLRKSFFSSSTSSIPAKKEEFNFESYVHFRVYNEILINQRVVFPPFRKEFERIIGANVLQLALRQQHTALSSISPSNTLTESLNNALRATDDIAKLLQTKGFVTSWERSIPLEDDIEDFADANSTVPADLAFSLALNEDVTLDSQLLLQELGFRLYPSIGRWMAHEALSQCFAAAAGRDSALGGGKRNINVQVDDYYMDTSYNSNPDLFKVKQILLNIVIQLD